MLSPAGDDGWSVPGDGEAGGDSGIRGGRLRLMFTCCHPALPLEARVALTLRTLAGLTTAEIARAFLVPGQTMGKRLVRAKHKIQNAGIPCRVPRPACSRTAPRESCSGASAVSPGPPPVTGRPWTCPGPGKGCIFLTGIDMPSFRVETACTGRVSGSSGHLVRYIP